MPMQVLRSAIIGSILVICASAAPARPLVIGYAPAFRPLAESIGRGDAGRYTHINIAFANPDASGLMVDGGKLTCMPRADRDRQGRRLHPLHRRSLRRDEAAGQAAELRDRLV